MDIFPAPVPVQLPQLCWNLVQMIAEIGGGTLEIQRRKIMLIFSACFPVLSIVPLLLYMILYAHHDPHFLPYFGVSTGMPIVISCLCFGFMHRIAASTARTESIVWIEICSPSLAIFISGFTTFYGLHKWEAFIVSVLLIVWGWSLEVALGLTTQLGLTNATASVAAGYVSKLDLSFWPHVLLMLVPVLVLAFLKIIARRYRAIWFPAPPPPPHHA